MLWGQPQPETVRDYLIAVETRDRLAGHRGRCKATTSGVACIAWKLPVDTTALRITVTATNGLDHARISEVRAYAMTRP